MSGRFPRPQRVVVKVGSSSLRTHTGLDTAYVTDLVAQLARLCQDSCQVVLTSSGAVAAGLAPLGLARRPSDLPRQQAAASVGQGLLMHTYQEAFAAHGLACGQVLLTPEDVVDRRRYLNARNTFDTLIELGAVPVVNENDTVVTDELRFGDNDRLAALVASMLGAELLVLLSDVDGLLNDGRLVERVEHPDGLAGVRVGPRGSDVGSGGMVSKLEAVRIARFSGAHSVIANARRPGVLGAVVAGEEVGTWFPPSPRRPSRRKLWIAFAPTPRGSVVIDAGAVKALVERGSSLLAPGVVEASGDFAAGDAVEVVGPDGRAVARGLVACDRARLLELRDGPAAEEGTRPRAVIHRDSLVVVI